jgi:hypothetical protein
MYTITVQNEGQMEVTTCSIRVRRVNGITISHAKYDEVDKDGVAAWASKDGTSRYVIQKTGIWKPKNI